MDRLFMVMATLCLGLAAVGCGQQQKPTAVAKQPAPDIESSPGEPAHPERGPRGGQLIELGEEEYHAELLHDDDTHVVTVYMLDGEARNDVAISAPNLTIRLDSAGAKDYQLGPVALDHETHAAVFCYETMSKELCHALDEEGASATLLVKIDGRTLKGAIEHVHDHDHDHEHGHAHHGGDDDHAHAATARHVH